ncbi:unnamed protein product [Adineta ricciae]|uniref:Uncharacterized protein n=1 Tax=Adineta ricciae TaxID=249248 RepID=A0A814L0R6_ADIRI|nr:unnamed protein product [Adineta ricciae]
MLLLSILGKKKLLNYLIVDVFGPELFEPIQSLIIHSIQYRGMVMNIEQQATTAPTTTTNNLLVKKYYD